MLPPGEGRRCLSGREDAPGRHKLVDTVEGGQVEWLVNGPEATEPAKASRIQALGRSVAAADESGQGRREEPLLSGHDDDRHPVRRSSLDQNRGADLVDHAVATESIGPDEQQVRSAHGSEQGGIGHQRDIGSGPGQPLGRRHPFPGGA